MLTIMIGGQVVPYTRMTQRGKYNSPKAQKYLASQESIAWQMASQVSWKPYFRGTRLSVSVRFHGKYSRCDLDNMVKAVVDAAKGILWQDDSQIDEFCAWRGIAGEADEYQTTVFVQEVLRGGDAERRMMSDE